MIPWLRLAPYLAGAAVAIGIWWHGHSTGRQSAELDAIAQIEALETRLADVSAANRAAAAELEARRIAQQTLAQELEDEARRDPDAVRRVPAPDSLRRLERRWGTAH
ncbi:MAG: hypothetical protein MUD11_13450 [Rhodobacteraceae bacterium]|jgi:hypothetical protein|nr:hypothetical protein [Paracoccaceae bacterium]